MFNDARFEIWKAKFRIFIQSNSFELWETIINDVFIPTHQIDGEVVDKPDSLWTVKEKIKIKMDFKDNNFLVMTLDDIELLYIYNYKTAKEIWNTLEMIYGVSPSIDQEKINIQYEEGEGLFHMCTVNFRNVKNYIVNLSLTNV